jgi:acyl-coenzyme A thioesterase PaaI-like protein
MKAADHVMGGAQEHLTPTEIESFLKALAFVREYAIGVVSVAPGAVTIELPFDERFSGPPGQFPASIVGTAGDVAAVSSCLSLLPKGWALATLDFTIKMTGIAKGEKLRARGRVLQAGRTNSVGAADVYVVSADGETLCGTVLATTRNFQIRPPPTSTA